MKLLLLLYLLLLLLLLVLVHNINVIYACEAGEYWDNDLENCKACYLNGAFCPGNDVQMACPYGQYCPDPTDPDMRFVCPKGHYCRAGSSSPKECIWPSLSCTRQGLHKPEGATLGVLFLASSLHGFCLSCKAKQILNSVTLTRRKSNEK